MDKYNVKIVMVSTWGHSFNRVANDRCAEVVEQGYRFHSATPLSTTEDTEGRILFSQTFLFEKGEKK